MLRKSLQSVIALMLGGVIAFSCRGGFREGQIPVEVVLETEKPFECQLFWVGGVDSPAGFAETKSIRKKIEKAGGKTLAFRVPEEKLSGIRLDFGTEPGRVVIDSIRLGGHELSLLKVFTEGTRNQLEKVSFADGKAVLESREKDPFIVFPKELAKIEAKVSYDLLPLFTIFTLSALTIFLLLQGIISQAPENRWTMLVFPVLASLLLLYPVHHIYQGKIDPVENRTLAAFPSFRKTFLSAVSGRAKNAFSPGFETWLNDRFSGRHFLISVHDRINQFIDFGHLESDRAFRGKENWLFYKGDESVALYQNRRLFSDNEMNGMMRRLERQKEFFAKQGMGFFLFIAPNKSDVYGEYYLEGIRKMEKEDRVTRFGKYLERQNSDISFQYPLEAILEHKKDGLLYRKNDTHWSEHGAYIGYLELMGEIKTEYPLAEVLRPEQMKWKSAKHEQGDLMPMLHMKKDPAYGKEEYLVPEPVAGYTFTQKTVGKTGNREIVETENPGKPYRVLVFRDSFSSALIPYLSQTFGHVVYVWDHNMGKYAELIKKEAPDFVVHEAVSRYAQQLAMPMPGLGVE